MVELAGHSWPGGNAPPDLGEVGVLDPVMLSTVASTWSNRSSKGHQTGGGEGSLAGSQSVHTVPHIPARCSRVLF